MRITIVSDAWKPQVNGVVRTLDTVSRLLRTEGHAIEVIGPDRFRTVPCPSYPEIRLAILPGRRLAKLIEESRPDAIHIATEGPLGMAARNFCRKRKLPFTTSFHTKFPEYVHARLRVPVSWSYAWLRRFHGDATRVMVATPSLDQELADHGFTNLARWTRGVDTELFRLRELAQDPEFAQLKRPLYAYVGRVAVEKNIGAFLALDLDGTRMVVGDGPQLADLKRRYPDVHFVGAKHGEDLARHYAAADVFVFPSLTDTFGLVLLEALASGVPVAAYPVTGPLDVIGGMGRGDPHVGVLDQDLAAAARQATHLSRNACRAYAEQFSWAASAAQFLANLEPFHTVWSPVAAGTIISERP